MPQQKLVIAVLAGSLLAAGFSLPTAARAQEQTVPDQPPVQEEWLLYGSPLMSPRERAEFRVRMRDARTAERQEAVRREYYGRMQERARQRGITLPGGSPAGRGQDLGGDNGTGAGGGTSPGTMTDIPPASDSVPGTVPGAPVTDGQRSNGPVPGGTVPGGPVPGRPAPEGAVPGTTPGGMSPGGATVPGGGGTAAPEGDNTGTGGAR